MASFNAGLGSYQLDVLACCVAVLDVTQHGDPLGRAAANKSPPDGAVTFGELSLPAIWWGSGCFSVSAVAGDLSLIDAEFAVLGRRRSAVPFASSVRPGSA